VKIRLKLLFSASGATVLYTDQGQVLSHLDFLGYCLALMMMMRLYFMQEVKFQFPSPTQLPSQ